MSMSELQNEPNESFPYRHIKSGWMNESQRAIIHFANQIVGLQFNQRLIL